MRRWFTVLFAACLAALAPAAHAAVQFQGLSYTPQGACVADLDGDGRLSLHNLGSSGQDGVSIWSPRSNGMRVALDGMCSSSDVGSSVSLECTFSLNGLPPGTPVLRVASSSFSVTGTSCACTCDFSSMCSSPSMDVVCYRDGAVVARARPGRTQYGTITFDASGRCPNPSLSMYREYDKSSPKLCSRFSFPSSVHFVLAQGGIDVDCDEVVYRCDPDEDCDGVSSFLRVTAPPASSFSSLTCSSGACRALDHWVCGTGQASLDVVDVGSSRRVRVNNIGSSGQDGVEFVRNGRLSGGGAGGGAGGSFSGPDDCDDGDAVSMRFSPPGLTFDPSSDQGSSSVLTVVGSAFSSTGAPLGSASASLTLTVVGSNFFAIPSHTGGGLDQEWVSVLSHGVEVARALLPPGSHVQIDAPPGGPLGMAINEKGLPGEKGNKGTKKMLAGSGIDIASAARIVDIPSSRGHVVDLQRTLHVCFAGDRVFVWGGVSATGDEMRCWAASSSGADDGAFDVTQCREFVRCASSSSSLSSLELLDVVPAGGDAITPRVGSSSISTVSSCTSIPFVFSRSDETPVRAYSVTFHLSPELATCGASVVEGDYLSRVAGTQLFVTDNGGGSYTVDCGIMGTVCGATGEGTLFSLSLGAASGVTSGVGSVVVDDVLVRDCSNQPVPAAPGATGFVPIQLSAPPALSSFTATQVVSGNPAGSSTTGVQLSWSPPSSSTSSVEVWRKGFGNYPLYDNAPNAGSVPPPPATPAAASSSGWTRAQCACSSGACGASSCTTPTGMLDQPSSRDFFYYVAFVRDVYGNPSAASSTSSGTLDYHLGDVSDGTTPGQGDDHVDIADVTLLGAHYGTTLPPGSPFSYLDVGPTLDYSTHARPSTDGRINFEDFMMFAINFAAVSAPEGIARPAAAVANALRLDAPPLPGVGGTFAATLHADGAGDALGLSVRLAYDAAVVEPVGVEPGALLDQQGRPGAVLSSDPGDVDVALLGAGPGLAGSGELARVTFRVKAAGDPRLGIASVRARDGANQDVAVAGVGAGPSAARTGLSLASTNPFRDQLALQLSLPASGPASVSVFDVAGRRVRTLVSGAQSAGTRAISWDGRDDAGLRLAPGAYVIRLQAGAIDQVREVRLVR